MPAVSEMRIAFLEPGHYEAVEKIYLQGIASGNATFQLTAPDWKSWDEKHLKVGRLVALNTEGSVIGWAALTPVSGNCAYAGVAEVSVYIDAGFRGKGTGMRLLEALISESEKQNLWTLQAGIFPENFASLKIHERCGFRQVGYREKIGQLNGVWRNTILLERRSKSVGA